MIPRPGFTLPIWAALAIPGAAYLVRSVIRGMDFRPVLPDDLIVLVVLAVGTVAVIWSRAERSRETVEDGTSREE